MKERLVKRWRCEYCKKSGGRRDVIERHESRWRLGSKFTGRKGATSERSSDWSVPTD